MRRFTYKLCVTIIIIQAHIPNLNLELIVAEQKCQLDMQGHVIGCLFSRALALLLSKGMDDRPADF